MPLTIDGAGQLSDTTANLSFADRPYCYSITATADNADSATSTVCDHLSDRHVLANALQTHITGRFVSLNINVEQVIEMSDIGVAETISLANTGECPVRISNLAFGFRAALDERSTWRLTALPFFVQQDGSRHDYSTENLLRGEFENVSYTDLSRPDPPLVDNGRLRSEAWAWRNEIQGIVVAKYNPNQVELSVASVDNGELRFGGVGSSLYGEPSAGHRLAPGQSFTYGTTHYLRFEGGLREAAAVYRSFLERHGHGFPIDYDPPVNWNVLYDIGWFHSDPVLVPERYNRASLLDEASKAKDCGCSLLYLDPGWEVLEGTTQWAEGRLGSPASLAETLDGDFGLALGFRTILRCYGGHWPDEYLILNEDGTRSSKKHWDPGKTYLWNPCLAGTKYFNEKLNRISDIIDKGRVKFLMMDEMDWRGACHDPHHGHQVPSTPSDHIDAVYNLCRELRRRFPDLAIECHDPLWPWHTSIYAPTYYGQGFDGGAYQETWGFEYMWNTLADLKSGKALALYAYNLGCNIPIYLHITMASDNNNALFFWWAASTVRHLGIGGKYGHASVGATCDDPETRFAAYREAMADYNKLKPYFVRGTFHGIGETAHLHTLPGKPGGVLVLFNLTDDAKDVACEIPFGTLQSNSGVQVIGADSSIAGDNLRLSTQLAPMSARVVRIGEPAQSD